MHPCSYADDAVKHSISVSAAIHDSGCRSSSQIVYQEIFTWGCTNGCAAEVIQEWQPQTTPHCFTGFSIT